MLWPVRVARIVKIIDITPVIRSWLFCSLFVEDLSCSAVPASTLRAQYEQVEATELHFSGEVDGFHGSFLAGCLCLLLQFCARVEVKQFGIATPIQLFGLQWFSWLHG